MFNRFADPGIERAYVEETRTANAPVVRWLAVIAMVAISASFVANPLYFASADVVRYNQFAAPLVVLQGAFFLLTRTRFYARSPWLDGAVYAVSSILMLGISSVQAAHSDTTGWLFAAVVTINTYSALAFSFQSFVASARWHLLWVIFQLVLYLAALAGTGAAAQTYGAGGVVAIGALVVYANWAADARARQLFELTRTLAARAHETEALLHNVLPQRVVDRLRAGETVADAYFDVTVIYIDIVDFSGIARRLAPGHLVELLNRLFSAIDNAADAEHVEKIKTLGDAYLAIAGTGREAADNAAAAVRFARRALAEAAAIARDLNLVLDLRIAVHTGPIVGGVIGKTRMSYDYWGETMNVVSRLQGAAIPGGICLSEASWRRTRDPWRFDRPRQVTFKGLGEFNIYDLLPE